MHNIFNFINMKKFLVLLVAVVMMAFATACTSCSDNVKFGIEYSLTSDGVANGNVALNFDGGHFNLNGKADYQLEWSNQLFTFNAEPVELSKALLAKDAKVAETAQKVDTWVNDNIYISSASGTYDIYVKGYIKETATQLTFEIDKHFTNKQEELEK